MDEPVVARLREEFIRVLTDDAENGETLFDGPSGFPHHTTITLAMVMENYDKAVRNL